MQESATAADGSFHLSIKISKDDREDLIFDDDVSESAIRRVIRLADDLTAKKPNASRKKG